MRKPVRIAQVLQKYFFVLQKYLFRLNEKTCANRTGFAKLFIQTQCRTGFAKIFIQTQWENLCESHRFCKNIYSDSMGKPVRIAQVLQKYLFRINGKTCASIYSYSMKFLVRFCKKNIYFWLNEISCANLTG